MTNVLNDESVKVYDYFKGKLDTGKSDFTLHATKMADGSISLVVKGSDGTGGSFEITLKVTDAPAVPAYKLGDIKTKVIP